MGYYLLDHRTKSPTWYTTRRTCKHGVPSDKLPHLLVIHTAENLPDISGVDTGAESVARYGANTDRSVSWHATVDSDSTIMMLPDSYLAWHVRGFNTCSWGLEIATQARKWPEVPEAWMDAVLRRAGAVVREVALRNDIPIRRLSGSNPSGRGIVSHSQLDPTRRYDPGPAFDWTRFLRYAGGTEHPNEEDDVEQLVKNIQTGLKRAGFYTGAIDGDWGPLTQGAWDAAMKAVKEPGPPGPKGDRGAPGPAGPPGPEYEGPVTVVIEGRTQ